MDASELQCTLGTLRLATPGFAQKEPRRVGKVLQQWALLVLLAAMLVERRALTRNHATKLQLD